MRLKSFLTVAKYQSFSKAAKELYISQPAISRQIVELEVELESVLFDRSYNPIKLTDEGKIYYEFFVWYSNKLENIKNKIKTDRQNYSATVSIGCLSAWDISSFFPNLINVLSKESANSQVTLEAMGFQELIDSLHSGELDLIICIDYVLNNLKGITIRKVTEIPSVLIYSTQHKLVGKQNLSLYDFKDDHIFVIPENAMPGVQKFINGFFQPFGIEPKLKCVQNVESLINGVQFGLGVAILDKWFERLENKYFKHLDLGCNQAIDVAWLTTNKNPLIPLIVNNLENIFNGSPKCFPK
jgi:DNA-binding transcriptional LysR family regulator